MTVAAFERSTALSLLVISATGQRLVNVFDLCAYARREDVDDVLDGLRCGL